MFCLHDAKVIKISASLACGCVSVLRQKPSYRYKYSINADPSI